MEQTELLQPPDNKIIIVPNAAVTGGNIVNYSAEATRRLDLVIGVSYRADLQRTREILTEIVKGDSRVLAEPEPMIAVLELTSSSVNLVVRPWVASSDYWALRFDLTQRIKERLDAEGIGIPFPRTDVHLHREAAA